MRSLFTDYWATAFFWLVAAGFAVSDIKSLTLQFLFWGAGLVFLIPPLRKQLGKICVIPSHLNPAPAKTSYDRISKSIFIGMTLLLIGSWLFFIYLKARPELHPLHDMPLRNVHNQEFTRENVPIDGYAYFDCTFTEVTFIYNGTTHFRLDRNTFNGPVKIKTTNFEAQHVMKFLGALGGLKNGFTTEGPEI